MVAAAPASENRVPKVDISENERAFVSRAEIPEINKEDVKVTVENDVLTFRGERKQEKEEKGEKFHRIERYHGSFCRSFSLPDNVDGNKINAAFKNGMLELTIPVGEVKKGKAIDGPIQ